MKRINAADVRAAYERLGWRPEQREWAVIDAQGRRCGCGLAAMAGFDAYQLFEKLSDYNTTRYEDVMEKELDLDFDYVTGFTAGFDGLPAKPWMGIENSRIGHADGAAAWEAVKDLA